MTDRERIMEMMARTGQELLYGDETYLEYENACWGENLAFSFDENGNLIRVAS
jgi:hypothetical protein